MQWRGDWGNLYGEHVKGPECLQSRVAKLVKVLEGMFYEEQVRSSDLSSVEEAEG